MIDIDALAPGMLVKTMSDITVVNDFILGETSAYSPTIPDSRVLSSTPFLVLGFYQQGGIKHVRFLMNGKTVMADNRSLDCMEILR